MAIPVWPAPSFPTCPHHWVPSCLTCTFLPYMPSSLSALMSDLHLPSLQALIAECPHVWPAPSFPTWPHHWVSSCQTCTFLPYMPSSLHALMSDLHLPSLHALITECPHVWPAPSFPTCPHHWMPSCLTCTFLPYMPSSLNALMSDLHLPSLHALITDCPHVWPAPFFPTCPHHWVPSCLTCTFIPYMPSQWGSPACSCRPTVPEDPGRPAPNDVKRSQGSSWWCI